MLGSVLAAAVLAAALAPGPDPDPPRRSVALVHPPTAAAGDLAASLALEIWECERPVAGPFRAEYDAAGLAALSGAGIPYRVVIPDADAHHAALRAEIAAINRRDQPGWFDNYRTRQEIEARLAELAAAHADVATLAPIGRSVEGRDILGLRITDGPAHPKPVAVVIACQHAREWTPPMSAMYVIDRLLETRSTDPRVASLLHNLEFRIVPLANPDGYEYTWTTAPMWRKNRRDNPGTTCDGIDLNRNWGHQWGLNSGSSGDPCSETYRGPAPFSEPETAAVRDLAASLDGRVILFWDVHAFGQLILSPWGYTTSPPPTLAEYNAYGAAIQAAIRAANGITYRYGPCSTLLYLISGGAEDWFHVQAGAWSWLVELGTAFQPPPAQILPIARGVFEGLLAVAGEVTPCYADCDPSGGLDIFDFLCFQNRFDAGSPYACDCDTSTGGGLCDIFDFLCFQNAFAAGCP